METPNNRKDPLVPVDRSTGLPATRQSNTLVVMLRAAAQPVPLRQPQIDSGLTALSPLERSVEVIRYSLYRLEFWLSPRGHLRAWFRLNLLVALLMAVPMVLVAPLLTYCFSTAAAWSQYLLATAVNILLTLVVAVGIAVILITTLCVIRRLIR